MKLARIYLIREIKCDSVFKMEKQYRQLKPKPRSCIFDLDHIEYQITNNLSDDHDFT